MLKKIFMLAIVSVITLGWSLGAQLSASPAGAGSQAKEAKIEIPDD